MSEKSEILKYIMHTPENTNPAIVKSMMEGMNESEVWDTTISGITSGSGDINFKYNGELLGSLSESGTAVLKTEMTICEHDIELEYSKPAGIMLPRFSYSLSGNNFVGDVNGLFGAFLESVQNKIVYTPGLFYSFEGYIIPAYIERQLKPYSIRFTIPAESDNLNVILNGSAVNYSSGVGYAISFDTANYPEEVTLSISDKE